MPSLLHKQQKLAVLIDAENASHTLTRPILLRAACYGVLSVKLAYADWSRPGMRRFKEMLHRNAIEAVHLFNHTTGKNAADMVLSLDAMGLMNTGQLDGFCIVSSDRSAYGVRGCGCMALVGSTRPPRLWPLATASSIPSR